MIYIYALLCALGAALVWLGVVLHHTHVHCIRGAQPAIELEACAKVQK